MVKFMLEALYCYRQHKVTATDVDTCLYCVIVMP